MIETVLIQRMRAVVPFEAYCRYLARTISDLRCRGNLARGCQIPRTCLRRSSPFFGYYAGDSLRLGRGRECLLAGTAKVHGLTLPSRAMSMTLSEPPYRSLIPSRRSGRQTARGPSSRMASSSDKVRVASNSRACLPGEQVGAYRSTRPSSRPRGLPWRRRASMQGPTLAPWANTSPTHSLATSKPIVAECGKLLLGSTLVARASVGRKNADRRALSSRGLEPRAWWSRNRGLDGRAASASLGGLGARGSLCNLVLSP
jgi:hypothetical protein